MDEISSKSADQLRIRVLLFARLAQECGRDELHLQLAVPASVEDVAAATEAATGLSLCGCMAAVNERYASRAQAVHDEAVVAFLPPISGGSGETFTAVTAEPLSLAEAEKHVLKPEFGAQSYFVGTVRSPNRGAKVLEISYQAYVGMAERHLCEMAEEVAGKHAPDGQIRIYLVHRTGELSPTEASVIVAVGSPHRATSIAACNELIELVKARVPVWKLERLEGGEAWVEGQTPAETF